MKTALLGAILAATTSVEPEWGLDDRSPSGLLYQPPPPLESKRASAGWDYSAWIELGALGGDPDTRAALFRMYKDLERGAYVDNFGASAEKRAEARFLETWGGNVGRDDAYYGLTFGRYNDWKVKAFYNRTPHVHTTQYRSLWNGVGSGNLTLADPALFPPGGRGVNAIEVENNINAFVATAPDTELAVGRKEGGARLELRMSESWRAFASFSSEKRRGARPFGAVWGGGEGNNNLEIAEPIDYTTHQFSGGVQFADSVHSFNAQVAASFFRNNIGTLVFESPMPVFPSGDTTGLERGAFATGRFDLVPDNDYYNVRAEYARAFPSLWKGRLTALASFSSSRQDDALLPSLQLPGLAVHGVAGGGWHTAASLSREQAGTRFDSRLLDVAFAFNPRQGLDIKLKARRNETDNRTDYIACNPLTGQWGRVLNDGSGVAIVTNSPGTPAWPIGAQFCNLDMLRAHTAANRNVPIEGDFAIRNIPWDYKQTILGATADFALGPRSAVNASYEREEMDRRNRERDRTWEDRLKLAYVNRALAEGTLRVSLGHDRRRGTEYTSDPYRDFTSASLGALPAEGSLASWVHVLGTFRKHDLADRDQTTANARFNYPFSVPLDAALSATYRDIRYPHSDYGRTNAHRVGSLNVELNYQPTPKLAAYGFAGWQRGRMSQAAIAPLFCIVGIEGVTPENFGELCSQAGGPLYPLERTWSVTSRDRNATGGGGVRYDFGKVLTDLNIVRASGRTRISYAYDPAAFGIDPELAGSGMPDLVTSQTFVEANVVVPVTRALALRFLYRHERGRIRDWHYDGVAATRAVLNGVYLDAGPGDYRADIFGIFVRISL